MLFLAPPLGATAQREATLSVAGKPVDAVWDATVQALSRKLVIVSSDRGAGTLTAEATAGMMPIGDVFEIRLTATTTGVDVHVVNTARSRIQVVSLVPKIVDSIRAELGMATGPPTVD